MTIDYQIKDKKLQHDIKRETAKISTLPSGQTHKYEYLTGEEILPSNQKQQNKQNLLIVLQKKPLKNKQKQLNTKEKRNKKTFYFII